MDVLGKQPFAKGPAEMFTGDVYFDVIAKGEEPSRLRVNAVHFTPCARTAWHTHAAGQTLHVTEGVGLVQSHGAAPEHFMTHLAIWEAPLPGSDEPETTWGEHVTDDEYRAGAGS